MFSEIETWKALRHIKHITVVSSTHPYAPEKLKDEVVVHLYCLDNSSKDKVLCTLDPVGARTLAGVLVEAASLAESGENSHTEEQLLKIAEIVSTKKQAPKEKKRSGIYTTCVTCAGATTPSHAAEHDGRCKKCASRELIRILKLGGLAIPDQLLKDAKLEE